jgi:acetyl-CoA carboxylase carboxyltransferase component
MELPEEDRAAFIDAKRREYEEDIDVYEVASDFSIEAVIPSDELREELIRRYEIYSRKDVPPPHRRNGVIPV